jgi:hypothetical protein
MEKLPHQRRCRGWALAHWTWLSRNCKLQPFFAQIEAVQGHQLFAWPDSQAPMMLPVLDGSVFGCQVPLGPLGARRKCSRRCVRHLEPSCLCYGLFPQKPPICIRTFFSEDQGLPYLLCRRRNDCSHMSLTSLPPTQRFANSWRRLVRK